MAKINNPNTGKHAEQSGQYDIIVDQMEDLRDRVKRFNMLQLPGQPLGMHMGTSRLVNDLWRELQRLFNLIKPN